MVFNLYEAKESNAKYYYSELGDADPLIVLLRSNRSLSADLRNFIAEILAGKVKKKSGVKLAIDGSTGRRLALKYRVSDLSCRLKTLNKLNPTYAYDSHGEAMKTIAGEAGFSSTDAFDKYIYPRKPKKSKKSTP